MLDKGQNQKMSMQIIVEKNRIKFLIVKQNRAF